MENCSNLQQTKFDSTYQPQLVLNQNDLSMMIAESASPAASSTRREETCSKARPKLNEPLDRTQLRSLLDRSGIDQRINYAIDETIRSAQTPSEISMNRLFDSCMSTVILIASGDMNVSNEHLTYSEGFLRSVRDRYGNHPPNVTKLLRIIRNIRQERTNKDGTDSIGGDVFQETFNDNIPENITLTKIPAPTANGTIH
ncbi:uncharacterized protein LOC129749709 [Uranotaenia lowii]|uniref:uncharacterized protein LOC129749709 n=1 Tax=Uranotaenia lowii TaxID=190385 RepID=UPI00247859A5|nr:uncharacterized protein LOC129749709 [Uranotaenia lowii]